MLTFFFSGAEGKMTVPELLTSGMVGKQVRLDFSPEWEGLHKNVVYQAGDVRVIRLGIGNTDIIPAEVLEKPLEQLTVGVYGVSADETLVIPTIRAQGPVIVPGVDPNADPATEPALPVWAQLEQLIGDLSQLETGGQGNLVEAINAAALTGDGDPGATFLPWVDENGILSWTNDRGLRNPTPVQVRGAVGPEGPAGATDYDTIVKGIANGGLSAQAPENTIPAFVLAKQQGFGYVRTAVRFTSDEVAVLLYDSTVDRTSNGTGQIESMTITDAFSLDFGSWKGTDYANAKICDFTALLDLCRMLALRPYVELREDATYGQSRMEDLVESVWRYGMAGKVTWISTSLEYLQQMQELDPEARLGYVVADITEDVINTAKTLENGQNTVFLDMDQENMTLAKARMCASARIPLEVRTVNDEQVLKYLDVYITGVTSDYLVAGKVLLDAGMDSSLSGSAPGLDG